VGPPLVFAGSSFTNMEALWDDPEARPNWPLRRVTPGGRPVLAQHDQVVEKWVGVSSGRVVKHTGDGVFF
jgi:hypothetical protein